MNEVTKVHLGRQAFTISIDAHHELKQYLDAIKKQVKDKEVVDEIEMRMAELLIERGVDAHKVILPKDIEYLKDQLGSPTDFTEADGKTEPVSPHEPANQGKRLFRDTDHAMCAGVAAGIGQYFGIDTTVVRALFVLLVIITAGWGILLYIVMWLIVPEAKTTSDRLQMAGKPVTVDSLKEMVEQADVNGAARRAGASLAGPINRVCSVIFKLLGVICILVSLSILFGLATGETYFIARHGAWLQDNIFPIGFSEHLLLYIAMGVMGLIAVFGILVGIALYRRKWPIRGWITGVLAGVLFIGLATGGAMAADVYPTVRDAYNSHVHSTTRPLKPFNDVNVISNNVNVNVNYDYASSYYVTFTYYDHPNINAIKTSVAGDTLTINTNSFDSQRSCQAICLPTTYNLSVTVYAPDINQIQDNTSFRPGPAFPLAPRYR